ncbi:hypothetical protein ACFL3Y_01625, partial [Pseudomonadota bacterium]
MNRQYFLALVVILGAFVLVKCSNSSDHDAVDGVVLTQAEASAIEVLEQHMEARNIRDNDGLAAVNNYPNIRIGADGSVVNWDTPEFFALWNEVSTFPYLDSLGWGHSEWDQITINQSDTVKVHITAQYSRYDVAGNLTQVADTFWVVTKQDGHWGMKFRSSFAEEGSSDEAAIAKAESAALEVLEQYMQARNDRDSESLSAASNYPYVHLKGGSFQRWDTPEDYIVYEETEVIVELDYSDWNRSEWGLTDIIQSSATKVHIVAELSRFNVLNEKYETTKSFWV